MNGEIVKEGKKEEKMNCKKYLFKQKKRALLGIINVLILQWIKENTMCGQDITDRIQEQFNFKIGSGTLYPVLYSLKKYGLVKTRLDKRKRLKKLYFLTMKGRIVRDKLIKEIKFIHRYRNLFKIVNDNREK